MTTNPAPQPHLLHDSPETVHHQLHCARLCQDFLQATPFVPRHLHRQGVSKLCFHTSFLTVQRPCVVPVDFNGFNGFTECQQATVMVWRTTHQRVFQHGSHGESDLPNSARGEQRGHKRLQREARSNPKATRQKKLTKPSWKQRARSEALRRRRASIL